MVPRLLYLRVDTAASCIRLFSTIHFASRHSTTDPAAPAFQGNNGILKTGPKLASDMRRPPPKDLDFPFTKPRPGAERDTAITRVILSIPSGFVSSYGKIAAAAGYPNCHRQVAQLLGRIGQDLPWQRVVGSNGELKTQYSSGNQQRLLLESEGVHFRGERVDMERYEHRFPSPENEG